MNDAAPVIAGLAVGISFVALFASFFSSTEIVAGQQYIDVSIEGLKTKYVIGEQITYTVKAKGYGVLSDTYPYARIINTDTNDMTNEMLDFVLRWDEPDDAPRIIDAEWPVAERYNDIIMYESGNYKLIVKLGDKTLERQFSVS